MTPDAPKKRLTLKPAAMAGGIIVLLIGFASLLGAAQPATQPMSRPAGQTAGGMMGGARDGSDISMGREAGSAEPDKMDKMAEAMTAMAQMCQAMMQREEAALRYVAVGAGVVGFLLSIALILFIVLEIQWIRFFGVRIKTEKSKLVQDRNERR